MSATHLEVPEGNVPCTRDLPLVITEIPLGSLVSDERYSVIVNDQVTETFTAGNATAPEPIAFEVGPCRMTRASQLPIAFEYKGTVPTGFDSINRASYSFSKPVKTVTVPLPKGILSITTREIVPPGEYEREITATSADGVRLVVSDQPGVLKTVTIIETTEFAFSFENDDQGWLTGFADLPANFDPDHLRVGLRIPVAPE